MITLDGRPDNPHVSAPAETQAFFEALERLAKYWESGVLTDDEYRAAKLHIIAEDWSATGVYLFDQSTTPGD